MTSDKGALVEKHIYASQVEHDTSSEGMRLGQQMARLASQVTVDEFPSLVGGSDIKMLVWAKTYPLRDLFVHKARGAFQVKHLKYDTGRLAKLLPFDGKWSVKQATYEEGWSEKTSGWRDAQSLNVGLREVTPHSILSSGPVVLDRESLRALCELLADIWVTQTRGASSLDRIFSHAAFTQIVAFGNAAIPFLLEKLPTDPERWSVVLSSITGERPVPDDAQRQEVLDAWLRWTDDHS